MNCMLRCYEADTEGESVPAEELRDALAQQVRSRQAAALYLHAATKADNAFAREFLRRRAARLISRG
jgi:hypothetical protein